MKDVLIVNVSYRGVSRETQNSILELTRIGAQMLSVVGVPDVALARNQALTMAVRACEIRSADEVPINIILLVDDDMVFAPDAAEMLVTRVRKTGIPWSACYATKDGKAACTRFNWDPDEDERWMVGLGFCAFTAIALTRLADQLGSVVGPNGSKVVPFCQSGVVTPPDAIPRWCSEDYWLSRYLHGFRLAPVSVGHLKSLPLYPDQATLDQFCES